MYWWVKCVFEAVTKEVIFYFFKCERSFVSLYYLEYDLFTRADLNRFLDY